LQIPLEEINDPLVRKAGLKLFVLRLDKMASVVKGNKYFKLKYNIEEFRKLNTEVMITFGGAFSNHIAAVAAAGKEYGFVTVGIIRGEETLPMNPVLEFSAACGMTLQYISREQYREKNAPHFIEDLKRQYPNAYILPEGGTNELAVKGCGEILRQITSPFDHVCCAVGTGGTMAGIISSLNKGQNALGVAVLKGGEFLKNDIATLLKETAVKGTWQLETGYHFGGYAKHDTELNNFISRFSKENNISLDPVYTGKMMFGLFDMIHRNCFKKGETVIAIHTGGHY